MKNTILIIGTIFTIGLIILWMNAEKSSYEPYVALAGAVLTLIGYFYTDAEKTSSDKKQDKNNSGNSINLKGANILSNGKTNITGGDSIKIN